VARALIDENRSEWVAEKELIADGDPDVSYQIRPISVKTYRRISEEKTTLVLNRRTHRKDSETDHTAVSDALLDFALVGWKGIESAPGVAAPCTVDAKLALPGILITAIVEYATQTGGAHGRSPEERRESFRATE
jgi:hypothetical protein